MPIGRCVFSKNAVVVVDNTMVASILLEVLRELLPKWTKSRFRL